MDDLNALHHLCSYYQRILHIQDWKISLHFVDRIALQPDISGHTDFNPNSKTATIKILKEADFFPSKGVEVYDSEEILVHELLHLSFYAVDKDDCPEFEQAIDLTACAIVDLARKVAECQTKSEG